MSSINTLAIEGVLERVVYQSEDDGFTVARLQMPGRKDLITIVGNILSANPGETLRLSGQWEVNVKFGRQREVRCALSSGEAWIGCKNAQAVRQILGSEVAA